MHANQLFVQKVLKASAVATFLTNSAFDELDQAVRAASNGKMSLSPGVAGVVEAFLKINGAPVEDEVNLTARAHEVLQLGTEGTSTHDVATQLHISLKTVETHRRQLMRKLDLYTAAELTKDAIHNGSTRRQ